jgi:Glu-tRNA(Gln) amidotransferase subunit E-like FAD-binding protein
MSTPYSVKGVVDADEVPDWERTQPKWTDLVDQVMALEPGQALQVEFTDQKAAERARNAVRDTANARARAVVVRTRLRKTKDGAMLYLTRVNPLDYEQDEKD